MSGPADVWQEVAEHFDRNYQAVGDDQWDASTPCAEWTVRELVDHAVGVQAGVAKTCGASTAEDADWPTVRADVAAAIADPANLEGNAPPNVFGGMPKHQLLGVAVSDLLVHSWDLARAVGGDETLPTDAVQGAYMGLQRFPEDQLRNSGMFGPAVEVPDDASMQDKLLGYAGRRP